MPNHWEPGPGPGGINSIANSKELTIVLKNTGTKKSVKITIPVNGAFDQDGPNAGKKYTSKMAGDLSEVVRILLNAQTE